MYVGTQCGLVIYYVLEEHKTPLKKVVFQSKVKGRIQLGAEKARYSCCDMATVLLLFSNSANLFNNCLFCLLIRSCWPWLKVTLSPER